MCQSRRPSFIPALNMVSFFCGKGQGWKEIAHFHLHESGQPRLTCSKYVRHHQTQCFPLLFDFAISTFRCKREGLCRSIWMSVFPRIGLKRMARMTEQKLANILFATGNPMFTVNSGSQSVTAACGIPVPQ